MTLADETFMIIYKNVDILFGAHDAFLECPLFGTLIEYSVRGQIILKVLGAIKPKTSTE
jgi:hypothetical protein